MSELTWRAVAGVDWEALGAARHQAHNAAQWMARLANSFLPPGPGNEHLALSWDGASQCLLSRDFLPQLCVEFDMPELALQFRELGRPSPHRFVMDGRSPAEVEAWILVELLHRHADRDRFSKALPYEIPDLMTGDGVDFMQEPLQRELTELAAWFANAGDVLARLGAEESAWEASPIQCCPRGFDLSLTFSLGQTSGSQSARAGFAPGDTRRPEPFFYVTCGPERSLAAGAGLPRIGSLTLRDTADAVLPASDIVAKKLSGEQVLAWLKNALASCRRRSAS